MYVVMKLQCISITECARSIHLLFTDSRVHFHQHIVCVAGVSCKLALCSISITLPCETCYIWNHFYHISKGTKYQNKFTVNCC